MPRWRYAPWRRYVMQAVMWVILGATVALAALVTNEARRASRVRLDDPHDYGDITVSLPSKWNARTRAEGNPRILVQATETQPDSRARVLTISRDVTDVPLSPLQYLVRNYSIATSDRENVPQRWTAPQALTIGGWAGVMVSRIAPANGASASPLRVEFVACAVMPSRRVITVELEGFGPSDSSDLDALQTICHDMKIGNEPPLGHAGEALELAGGIRLITPDGFVPVSAKDPNRTDRRLWLKASEDGDSNGWAAIDLVPVMFDSRETRQQIYGAISTLLMSRDPAWRTTRINEEQPDRWHAQLETAGEKDLSTTAHLLAGANGHALLAIFHGAGESQTFERAWSQICSTTTFTATKEMDEMLATGAAEVARLRGIGLDNLAGNARENEWWLWCDQSNEPHLGWSQSEWARDGWSCSMERRVRRPEHRTASVVEKINANNDFTSYSLEVLRRFGIGAQSQLVETHQSTQLVNGQINTSVGQGLIWRIVSQQPAPAQFVPGGLLPLLVGKLSDKPMILRSESFVSSEALPTQNFLTLIVRPSSDVPRSAGSAPMRCVSVEVNGSGELSRWYFRENGDVECIDFAGGVQRLSSDFVSIQNAFRDDFR